jgi:predicted Zn-dependent peptidase
VFTKSVLPNGLRILTAPMPHTRSVSLGVYVGAGSRYETPERAGISHFVEHMLFKGTAKRPRPEDVSGAIEGVGGMQNASTDREVTAYWCKVARPHFELGLDVLLDMVLNSAFVPEEIEKERHVILEELAQVQDSPAEVASLLIDELMWPDQPLGRDIAGTRETVSGITRAMLLQYMAGQYGAANTVVTVTGNVEHQEVIDMVSASLDRWATQTPAPMAPAQDDHDGERVRVKQRRSEQAHVCLALPGLPADHPDRYVLGILSTALGEGMTSRLFLDIRERRGLAYDVHSYLTYLQDTGSVNVYAGVDPKNAVQTVSAIMGQLAELQKGLRPGELDRTRELLKGRMLLRMEDTRAVMSWLGPQELLTGEVKTVDDVVAQLDAITDDDLRRVANTVFAGNSVRAAVVGPFRSDRAFQKALAG